jgi:hypothetical protein
MNVESNGVKDRGDGREKRGKIQANGGGSREKGENKQHKDK